MAGEVMFRWTNSRANAAASEAVLFIFQLPAIRGMRTISFGLACSGIRPRGLDCSIRKCDQPRELFAFQKFEGRATTG